MNSDESAGTHASAATAIWQDEARSMQAGTRWQALDPASGATVVTFSFVTPGLSTFSYGSQGAMLNGFSAFSAADRELARSALASISEVCNIRFAEVADDASGSGAIRFGYSPLPTAMKLGGYAFFPSVSPVGGDVWIASAQAEPIWDYCRGYLILHETLHALGLDHPQGAGDVTLASDTYTSALTERPPWVESFPAEPMVADVAALQSLYGPSAASEGNTLYDLAAAAYRSGFHVIWDSGGADTLDASRVLGPVMLNLQPGSSSDIGVRIAANFVDAHGAVATQFRQTLSIADDCVIEDIIGSAFSDDLRGNGFDNTIEGNGGDDTIAGAEGLDVAVYAGPRSQYELQREGDTTWVLDTHWAEGIDTLHGVERLQFADGSIALDADGHAGFAVSLLRAVFGPQAAADPGVIGIALDYLDAGLGYDDAAQLALDIRLGAAQSMAEVAALVTSNVVACNPDAAFNFTATKDASFPVELVLAGVMHLAGDNGGAIIYYH